MLFINSDGLVEIRYTRSAHTSCPPECSNVNADVSTLSKNLSRFP
jgi:hypothetical protein